MKKFKFLFLSLLILFFFSCNNSEIKTNSNDFDHILSTFHISSSSKVLIVAHRAMHTKYPENSLAAFQHSIDSGVDIIETDIRTTKWNLQYLMCLEKNIHTYK